MSTETKHSPTPRPWSVRNHEFYSDMFELSPTRTVSNNACGDPECCGNYEEWTGMSEADAKFAVRAVNAFDDLVAALEAVNANADENDFRSEDGCCTDRNCWQPSYEPHLDNCQVARMFTLVRAALAKAKETT